MRFGRAKAGRKTLAYFRRTIGLEAPYQVLLHYDVVRDMLGISKIDNLVERLQKVLQEHKLHICVLSSTVDQLHQEIQHCQSSLQHHQDHLVGQKKTKKRKRIQKRIEEWAQQLNHHQQALEWIQRHCQVISHNEGFVMPETKKKSDQQQEQDDDEPQASPTTTTKKRPRSDRSSNRSTTDPIYAFLTRNNDENTPYIVAAQDPLVLDGLRQLGTVPIVRWADAHVLLLEQPPRASQRFAKQQEVAKYKSPVLEEGAQALVDLLQQQQHAKKRRLMGEGGQRRRLKKTMPAKGPNPLSCKQPKQKKGAEPSSNSTPKKKRTRTRIRPSKGGAD